MAQFAQLRDRMVEIQLAGRGIRDRRVLDAMAQVPRERFVESGFEEFAYEDGALPIASAQTISQPYIVALMSEAAELEPTDKVLEVGTGSGYAAAVASLLAEPRSSVRSICHGERASWDQSHSAAAAISPLGPSRMPRCSRRSARRPMI
jgi:protein-L-isoaspartate(D-aspartate) O-methyltransferase